MEGFFRQISENPKISKIFRQGNYENFYMVERWVDQRKLYLHVRNWTSHDLQNPPWRSLETIFGNRSPEKDHLAEDFFTAKSVLIAVQNQNNIFQVQFQKTPRYSQTEIA